MAVLGRLLEHLKFYYIRMLQVTDFDLVSIGLPNLRGDGITKSIPKVSVREGKI